LRFIPFFITTWNILSFQDRASSSIYQLIKFHDFAIIIVVTITIFVGLNIIFTVLLKYTDHHLLQDQSTEIFWTIFPIFILISIALPSLQALYLLDDPFKTNITLKVVGHQWYWSYEYSDFPEIEFDAYIKTPTDSLFRLLETDHSLVLPLIIKIRIIATASDVLHAWTIPVLGLKVDAIPGRLNQLFFIANRTGLFFGQCSEICGANHRFIPIKLEIVPLQNFINWVQINKD